jgi:hypothetical protein
LEIVLIEGLQDYCQLEVLVGAKCIICSTTIERELQLTGHDLGFLVADALAVDGLVVDDVVVFVDVALLYLGRYLIPVVAQLDFAPSIQIFVNDVWVFGDSFLEDGVRCNTTYPGE